MENRRTGMHESKKTVYKDVLYNSRLEAMWAAFFDKCGMKKDYETRTHKVGRGSDGRDIYYKPDFIVYGVEGVGDLYVEVKGNRGDALGFEKIRMFAEKYPILVVANLPLPTSLAAVDGYFEEEFGRDPLARPIFSWRYINGADKCAYLGVTENGKLGLFTAENRAQRDAAATIYALSDAINKVKEAVMIHEGRVPNARPETPPPPAKQEEQLALKLNALFGGDCDAIEFTPRNLAVLRSLADISKSTTSETANRIFEAFCREHHITL